ncbi:MAG: hypothetical protein Q9195_003480 [Heterodermia aff. obscurata]
MDDSGDSQEFSDDYPSDSSEYSSTSEDSQHKTLDPPWNTEDHPSISQIPPTISRPNLPLPEPQSRHYTNTTSSGPSTDRVRRNQSPRQAPSVHHNLPLPRPPAQFGLPNFPLPTASTGNPSLPYGTGIDSLESTFEFPSGWSDWDGVISPPSSRPASRVSWGSSESWHLPFPRVPNDFVDLTDDNPDLDMPPTRDRRRPSRPPPSASASSQEVDRPSKRRKTAANPKQQKSVKKEDSDAEVEEIDLKDVDDDNGLSKALQKQQEMAIKAQRKEESDKPVKLSNLSCIICLESMTDITATRCGHLFCHGCLMEALIAGEQQEVEPGKFNSRCPICREKVSRPKPGASKSDIITLEILTRPKSASQNLKVSITD